jgi:hypothetical protein
MLLLCGAFYAQALAGVEALGPLQRLHHHLDASLDLATRLQGQLGGRIAAEAISLEMRVSRHSCSNSPASYTPMLYLAAVSVSLILLHG